MSRRQKAVLGLGLGIAGAVAAGKLAKQSGAHLGIPPLVVAAAIVLISQQLGD